MGVSKSSTRASRGTAVTDQLCEVEGVGELEGRLRVVVHYYLVEAGGVGRGGDSCWGDDQQGPLPVTEPDHIGLVK